MSARTSGSPSQVLVGNRRLLAEHGLAIDETAEPLAARRSTTRARPPLLVAVDGSIAGVIGLRDTVRPEAHDVIHDLKHLKIGQVAVLTGDREPAARQGREEGPRQDGGGRALPADKAAWIKEQQEAGRKVAMVGDGINDAPALAQADAGIALGGMGADLAAEAGDLIILGDPLRDLPDLVELSRATVRVIRQNIIGFAFGLNAVAVLLASLGILGPVAAAILHQVGSLLVLLNAMRLLAFGDWAELPPFRQLRALPAGGSAASTTGSTSARSGDGCVRRRGGPACARVGSAGLLYATSGMHGDRSRRGRAGPPVRRISGRARAGPAPPAAAPARSRSRGVRARPGAEPGARVPRRPSRARGEPLRWEASHGTEPGRRCRGRGRRRRHCC